MMEYSNRAKEFMEAYFKKREIDRLCVEVKHLGDYRYNQYRVIVELDVLAHGSNSQGISTYDDIYLSGIKTRDIMVNFINNNIDKLKEVTKDFYEKSINEYKKDILKAKSKWEIGWTKTYINELKSAYAILKKSFDLIDKDNKLFIVMSSFQDYNEFKINKSLIEQSSDTDMEIISKFMLYSIDILIKDKTNFNEIVNNVSRCYDEDTQAFEEYKLKLAMDI